MKKKSKLTPAEREMYKQFITAQTNLAKTIAEFMSITNLWEYEFNKKGKESRFADFLEERARNTADALEDVFTKL
jgi:hypothetical protein